MPVVFRYKGYSFFFFSNERIPREPIHIHVRKGEALAKIWLVPSIKLAENYGFITSELKEILKVIEENKEFFERSWNEYFSK